MYQVKEITNMATITPLDLRQPQHESPEEFDEDRIKSKSRLRLLIGNIASTVSGITVTAEHDGHRSYHTHNPHDQL